MSEDTTVHAELRENFGKGFARRLRAAGKIPAVLYGHGTDPVHVALPGHQMLLLVRRANALIELDIADTTASSFGIWLIPIRPRGRAMCAITPQTWIAIPATMILFIDLSFLLGSLLTLRKPRNC